MLSLGTKVVTMVHDLIPLRSPETFFRNSFRSSYYRTLLASSIRKSDRILTNSAYSLHEISSQFPEAADKLRRVTLGVSVDVRQMTPAAEIRQKYNIRDDYFLAMGSTEPRKNNASVIRALNLLRNERPDLSLVIAGEPWRDRQFPRSLLNQHILEIGAVPDNDLWALMANAVALVFPSFQEGFGLPMIESMALGTPVITSRKGALPEIGGDAAVYANPESHEDICLQYEKRALE